VKTRIARVVRVLLGLGAIPILALAWILRPVVRIRLCLVGAQRFGHLALEPEMWLASNSERRRLPFVFDIWSLGSRRVQSNTFLADLWSQRLRSRPSWLVAALVRAGEWLPHLAMERAPLSIHGPRNALDRSPQQCPSPGPFSDRERRSLREHGFDVDKPFAAIVVRDSEYYRSRGEQEGSDTSLLNGNLLDFIPACRYLAGVGVQVVRLGGPSQQRLPQIPGCFDYANSVIRSAELDVKLPMSCRFAISTQTGPDALVLLARRPVLYLNMLRFSQFFFGTELATWVPMRFVNKSDDRPVGLGEICRSRLLAAKNPSEFADSYFDFVRASADEVAVCVADFLDELENGVDPQIITVRKEVNHLLQQHMAPWAQERFGDIRAKVSRRWLLDHESWWLARE
jgi:putative glycosyltransferase (TIGR04372 family)